ncbi:Para-aminobenzoate synthase, aminase component [hydrothermal vent metagenome]|uniref:Para-aminobenzoate synthase, aminase component n=1 Tax=hydrothermal vent metagenome TaxID=652676 RepID=A0A3B0QR79_9ZZZZ
MVIEPTDMLPTDAFLRLRDMERPFILSGGASLLQRRYSYVGAGPYQRVETDINGTTQIDGKKTAHGDPFLALRETMKGIKKDAASPTPFPFSGGAVGYFAYGLKDLIKEGCDAPELHKDSRKEKSGAGTPGRPLAMIGLYDPIYVYDHKKEKGFVVWSGNDETKNTFKKITEKLSQTEAPARPELSACNYKGRPFYESNITRDEYLSTLGRALDYISRGDIYQINISQRLRLTIEEDPFAVYLALLESGAGRFASFMDCGGFQIISNTPERLLKVEGSIIETEPIKGTRPRGRTLKADKEQVKDLRESIKENAEHLMIVDLERNDLGRVSKPGTVRVSNFQRIESYPTLHQMVSTVEGVLRGDVEPLMALRSCFPGGSITGAPKIRAMEVIEELESCERGLYTGGLGWIDRCGNMDIAMAIRTAIYCDGVLSLSVGGGIVADSRPEEEYQETLLKAEDFLSILSGNKVKKNVG